MKQGYENTTAQELYIFSKKIKKLMKRNQLDIVRELIIDQMVQHPDCAEPHNLLGIVEEIKNNHVLAMKHFRAAWALDPTYEPARKNMELFGEFTSEVRDAVFTVDDIKDEAKHEEKVKFVHKIVRHDVKKNIMKKVSMFTL